MYLSSWKPKVYYRKECLKTTWTFRIACLCAAALLAVLTHGIWVPAIGDSLACDETVGTVDAILIENFDRNYLLFERASRLHESGLGGRVLIPVQTSDDPVGTSVEEGIVEVMVRKSRLRDAEQVRVREVEPISLNAALDVRDFVMHRQIRSVIVVAPLFRSRRSALVYGATLGRAGISVRCEPVAENRSPESWTSTSHGVQNVLEQWLKLQYYRFYVLPFRAPDRL